MFLQLYRWVSARKDLPGRDGEGGSAIADCKAAATADASNRATGQLNGSRSG